MPSFEEDGARAFFKKARREQTRLCEIPRQRAARERSSFGNIGRDQCREREKIFDERRWHVIRSECVAACCDKHRVEDQLTRFEPPQFAGYRFNDLSRWQKPNLDRRNI